MAQRGTTRGTLTGSTSAGARPNSNGLRRSSRRVTPGASQRFVAATDQSDGQPLVVSVMGEVDLATALALEQTLLGAVEDAKGEVIVDFTGCNFLDSRGLGP